jgi:hypothetical protein
MVSTYHLNGNLESVPSGNQTWLASWEIPVFSIAICDCRRVKKIPKTDRTRNNNYLSTMLPFYLLVV